MTATRLVPLLLGALLAGPAASASAAEPTAGEEIEIGAAYQEYQRYCQSCHGERGRGDGRVGKWLKVPPSDLAGLSERNGGIFPEEKVARIIDGREEVRTHGPRDMPVWGRVFGEDVESDSVEARVHSRIKAMVEVLRWFDDSTDGPVTAN